MENIRVSLAGKDYFFYKSDFKDANIDWNLVAKSRDNLKELAATLRASSPKEIEALDNCQACLANSYDGSLGGMGGTSPNAFFEVAKKLCSAFKIAFDKID